MINTKAYENRIGKPTKETNRWDGMYKLEIEEYSEENKMGYPERLFNSEAQKTAYAKARRNGKSVEDALLATNFVAVENDEPGFFPSTKVW